MTNSTTSPKYPHVEVELSGQDGNSFFLIGRTRQALRRAGVPKGEIEAFTAEASSGDADHVLRTIMRTVETS